METTLKVLKAYFHNMNECMVWDPETAFELRTKYRLVGTLIGTIPGRAHNNYKSLPCLLLPEEVMLGLSRGWLTVVDNTTLPKSHPQEAIIAFRKERYKEFEHQAELHKIEKEMKKKKFELNHIHKSKKRKTDTKGIEPCNNISYCIDPSIKTTRIENKNTSSIITTTKKKITTTMSDNNMPVSPLISSKNNIKALTSLGTGHVKIHTYTHRREWINEKEEEEEEEERVISIEEWKDLHSYTDQELIKMRIFEDLWDQGHYITTGGKFGGDFLVYPDDPLRYHASYIVSIFKWDSPIPVLDIVSQGRLAVGVKKSTVLASVKPDSNNVVYIVVNWQGVT